MKDLDNWVFLIVAWILSIPTGIIINIVTPSIDTYLKNRSLSARERKIKTLRTRYIKIKNQREQLVYGERDKPPNFGNKAPIFFWLSLVSLGLSTFIFTLFPNYSFFRVVLVFIVSIPIYYSAVLMFKSLADSRDILLFEGFKRRTIRKLKRLGCSPKDYGIE